jgi:hypothetical protein
MCVEGRLADLGKGLGDLAVLYRMVTDIACTLYVHYVMSCCMLDTHERPRQ